MITDKTAMVALVPPKKVVDQLAPYCDYPDRLHMTIASLGEITDLSSCMNALLSAQAQLRPIDLKIAGLGFFPLGFDRKASVALVNGVGLDEWRHRIASELRRDRILKNERNGFLPHMTMSRKADAFLPLDLLVDCPRWTCCEFWLFRGYNLRLSWKVKNW